MCIESRSPGGLLRFVAAAVVLRVRAGAIVRDLDGMLSFSL
jgi:hypothetical protein